jgi:hypothetical protein
LRKYLALFGGDNPRGVYLHSSPKPWAPWSSDPIMVFDSSFKERPNDPCSGAGYGKFIHISWKDVGKCDHVQDYVISRSWEDRDNGWSGEYAPYQMMTS